MNLHWNCPIAISVTWKKQYIFTKHAYANLQRTRPIYQFDRTDRLNFRWVQQITTNETGPKELIITERAY